MIFFFFFGYTIVLSFFVLRLRGVEFLVFIDMDVDLL